MTDLIRRMLPDKFEDLIALVALFRPGPLQSGMVDDFINRKHGREPVRYFHPDLETILEPTYGIILYQEQVMQIAQVLAGYTLGSADLLRRAMGKKKAEEMARQREGFVDGAGERGVSPQSAGHIFDLIEKFAGYGFNKSHSAAYAMLSYQTAWLKTHFPAEFMSASMSADMEHTDKVVSLIAECRSLELELKPPDVNTCETAFTPMNESTILYGLGAIKGVGSKAVELLIEERLQHGEFSDLFDLCSRLDSRKFNRRVLQALINAGALDRLGANRATLSESLPLALDVADQKAQARNSGQNDMFGIQRPQNIAPAVLAVDEWTEAERLAREKETLGLYLTGHPLDSMITEIRAIADAPVAEIDPQRSDTVVCLGLVVGVRVIKTRRGDRMAVVTIDDKSGRMEVTLFADMFRNNRELARDGVIICAMGTVSLDEFSGGSQMRAAAVLGLDDVRSRFLEAMEISLQSSDDNAVQGIHEVLGGCPPGDTKVSFRYQREDGSSIALSAGEQWCRRINGDAIAALQRLLDGGRVAFRYNRAALRLFRDQPQDFAA